MRSSCLQSFALLGLLSSLFLLGGCSSIAEGVTSAVLDHQSDTEDPRKCEIEGAAFNGIRQSIDAQPLSPVNVTKVLMVHGISDHLPGYSSRFQKMLYEKLGLNIADSEIKNILLDSPDIDWKNDGTPHTLGVLRVTRHMNADKTRQLIFYELTWSPITEQQKKLLAADSANNEGLVRADLNSSLKSFINATVPDLLIYDGNGYQKITSSVTQSVCWMLADSWEGLPESGVHQCAAWPQSTFATLAADDHFFVTHSLGSRIAIDTIQNFASLERKNKPDEQRSRIEKTVRNKEFTVFMMANQLPLLQMGRDAPKVSGDLATYCSEKGAKASERAMRKMNIVAFSDPNDILSYPVPLDFMTTRIDSRICPSVTNVSLNIAKQTNLFDSASFANPLTAHTGYMEDDRVIDLISNGIRRGDETPLISKRCKWIEAQEFKNGN